MNATTKKVFRCRWCSRAYNLQEVVVITARRLYSGGIVVRAGCPVCHKRMPKKTFAWSSDHSAVETYLEMIEVPILEPVERFAGLRKADREYEYSKKGSGGR